MDFWLRLLNLFLYFTLPAGRLFGIPLRVHWLLLLFIPLFLTPFLRAGQVSGTTGQALLIGLVLVAILYGSILLHELGHCWGMRLVGNRAREIHLTPLGGVAIGEGENHSPRSELIVVGLGPLVSVTLAAIGWVLLTLQRHYWPAAPVLVAAAALGIFHINLAVALFNLLVPVFPLDASKLLRAGLSLRINPQKVTYYLANAGIAICIGFILAWLFRIELPVLGDVSIFLFLIALVGIQTCWHTLKMIEVDRVYSTYDEWGDRGVYLDDGVMVDAGRRLREDLPWLPGSGAGRGGRAGTAARVRRAPQPPTQQTGFPEKSRGGARIVQIAIDPESIDDPAELRRLMREAADADDFRLAARLKARLDRLVPPPPGQ